MPREGLIGRRERNASEDEITAMVEETDASRGLVLDLDSEDKRAVWRCVAAAGVKKKNERSRRAAAVETKP